MKNMPGVVEITRSPITGDRRPINRFSHWLLYGDVQRGSINHTSRPECTQPLTRFSLMRFPQVGMLCYHKIPSARANPTLSPSDELVASGYSADKSISEMRVFAAKLGTAKLRQQNLPRQTRRFVAKLR